MKSAAHWFVPAGVWMLWGLLAACTGAESVADNAPAAGGSGGGVLEASVGGTGAGPAEAGTDSSPAGQAGSGAGGGEAGSAGIDAGGSAGADDGGAGDGGAGIPVEGSVNALFIGNSFTQRHKLYELVETVAEEGNPNLAFEATAVIYGGRSLADHWRLFTQNFVKVATLTVAEEQAAIDALEAMVAEDPDDIYAVKALARHRELLQTLNGERKPWDVVVLQSWRDDTDGEASLYMEYAPKFATLAANQGGQVVLYETTPTTQNEYPLTSLPDSAPVLQKAATIKVLAEATDAIVVPMSTVVLRCQTERPDLTLRYVNDFHPNQTMAYLTAFTFFGALFQRSPQGLTLDRVTDTASLDASHPNLDLDGKPITKVFSDEDRADIQRIAWEGLDDFADVVVP